jgi:hypothetical protein
MSGKYAFRYGQLKIDNDEESLTGAQIKALIKAQVSSFDLAQDLVLEGDPDRVIKDDEKVDLTHQHGGPKEFFSRPPTQFGEYA